MSIFGASWLCPFCGQDLCSLCLEDIKVIPSCRIFTVAHILDQNNIKSHSCLPESTSTTSLIPCSRFTREHLVDILVEMKKHSSMPLLDLQCNICNSQILVESESKSSVLRVSAEKLTVEEFRTFLSKRLPLVMMGLNSSLCLSWSPSQLIAEYGKQPCTMEDCEAQSQPLHVQLEDFLSLFSPAGMGESSFPNAIWKVKVRLLLDTRPFSLVHLTLGLATYS
jgi:hypothetical protein